MIEKGNIVQLKSGSTPMVVVDIKEDAAYVYWQVSGGGIMNAYIPLIALDVEDDVADREA